MISSVGPGTSDAAGSGAKWQRYVQAEHSWIYKWWFPVVFCPDMTDLPEREDHEGNTSGAHSRPGTHILTLVFCDTQRAEPSRRQAEAGEYWSRPSLEDECSFHLQQSAGLQSNKCHIDSTLLNIFSYFANNDNINYKCLHTFTYIKCICNTQLN